VSGTEAKIVAIMKDQIQVEQNTLNHLVKLEEEAKEVAVRLAFMELRLDTWKHIKFLEGMIEYISTTPCDEWSAKVARYAGRVKLEREIDRLIDDENEMVNLLNQALGRIDDPVAQLLLEHLKQEEGNHLDYLSKWVKIIQQAPLQSKKGQKGTDIVCEID
jgi:bacterioferritin (cytochrome b1)